MKLYSVKLTYSAILVHVGCERFYGTAKRLMDRLLRDLCYTNGLVKGEIESRKVSLREWLLAE